MKKIIFIFCFILLAFKTEAATYQLTNNSLANNAQVIILESNQSYIPNDPKNDDYQTYLAWLSASVIPPNTPDPAPTLPTITAPSMSGCSMTSTSISVTNGTVMGIFTSGISGQCLVTISPGNQITPAHGWNCAANDLTTPKNIITQVLPFSTTSATISGTTASGDTVNFICPAF